MKCVFIDASSLSDAWFQCVYNILDYGDDYVVDRGSYEGQKRKEFDYITVHISHPGTRPLLPEIPPQYGIPNPVDHDYLDKYLPYMMTSVKQPGEVYTYGERIEPQMIEVIKMFKENGYGTNQACISVSKPEDIHLNDPPCCRSIDVRIKDGKMHFIIYFRSWDLWNGFPANLGGFQLMKEYMAEEVGVEDGEIIASSKGLHLYEYAWGLAKTRINK